MDYSKLKQKHQLFGKEYSYLDLKEFETVETFVDTSHETRSVVKDKEENYYFYCFDEEMGFPDDIMTEHFFLLERKEDGRKYAKASFGTIFSELRNYIWIGPGFHIKAVQS